MTKMEFLVLTEENVADIINDLLQRSGLLNGEVLEDAEAHDENVIEIRTAHGQVFHVTVEQQ